MRKPRFTFKNAFHHVMNRGLNGCVIFPKKEDKIHFLNLLYKKSLLLHIRIIAYCIMDNHYHLILQNTSEKMSDFMRQLNSEYGLYYRKKYGGRGYVFQDRYTSTLIQNEIYLKTSILYLFLNPKRAKLEKMAINYEFSSINELLGNSFLNITDVNFIKSLFGSVFAIIELLENDEIKLQERQSKIGKVIGDAGFEEKLINEISCKKENSGSSLRHSTDKWEFESIEEVIKEFEKKEGVQIKEINIRNLFGKRLRHKLLVLIRERCGLKYSEINRFILFQNLKLSSLSHLYIIAKEKL